MGQDDIIKQVLQMRPRRDSKASSSESSSACPWKWKLSKSRLQQVPPKIGKKKEKKEKRLLARDVLIIVDQSTIKSKFLYEMVVIL